ncbi:MAG: hypothetical protein WA667_22270 [Candidatus Nitrosopolaris sp.]
MKEILLIFGTSSLEYRCNVLDMLRDIKITRIDSLEIGRYTLPEQSLLSNICKHTGNSPSGPQVSQIRWVGKSIYLGDERNFQTWSKR